MFAPQNLQASGENPWPMYFPMEAASQVVKGHVRATRAGNGVRLGCTRCNCWQDVYDTSFPTLADKLNLFMGTHRTCKPSWIRETMLR